MRLILYGLLWYWVVHSFRPLHIGAWKLLGVAEFCILVIFDSYKDQLLWPSFWKEPIVSYPLLIGLPDFHIRNSLLENCQLGGDVRYIV